MNLNIKKELIKKNLLILMRLLAQCICFNLYLILRCKYLILQTFHKNCFKFDIYRKIMHFYFHKYLLLMDHVGQSLLFNLCNNTNYYYLFYEKYLLFFCKRIFDYCFIITMFFYLFRRTTPVLFFNLQYFVNHFMGKFSFIIMN